MANGLLNRMHDDGMGVIGCVGWVRRYTRRDVDPTRVVGEMVGVLARALL